MALLFDGVVIAAAVAIIVAFYKHRSLAAVEASAKKEIAYLETLAEKVGTTVKADFTAAVARLKAIF